MRALIAVAWLLGASAMAIAAPVGQPPLAPAPQLLIGPLRLAGDLPTVPPALRATMAGRVLVGSYRVCLDDAGRVSRVTAVSGIDGANEAVIAALHRWSWFYVSGANSDGCFLTPVRVGVPPPVRIRHDAGAANSGTRAPGGPQPELPPWFRFVRAGQTIDATYEVCLDERQSTVERVRPIVGVAGVDGEIMAALQASSWELVLGPATASPLCFRSPVHFVVRGLERRPNENLPPFPPTPWPTALGASVQAGVSLRVRIIPGAHDFPRLTDETKSAVARQGGGDVVGAYRSCVRADGVVESVEPLIRLPKRDDDGVRSVLRRASYVVHGAPGVGVCEATQLRFTIH